MKFTTPLSARGPYSTEPEPRTTSMRSTMAGFRLSGVPTSQWSVISWPSMRIAVRRDSSPRMRTRFNPGCPESATCTPGMLRMASASP